jgi:nitrilase
MPLLRHSLYSQNVNLYLAPTADARDTWLSLMRTVACEGRCFVLSANQCIRKKDLPKWIRGETVEENPVEDEDRKERHYRRRSVVTESGNEIALPVDKRDVSEEAVIEEEEDPRDQLHRRQSSIVTEHGHEIILPVIGEKTSRRAFSGGEDDGYSTGRPRRASFFTEQGHEIALPSDGRKYTAARAISDGDVNMNSTGNGRKESFITEDGHEIICPTIGKSKFGKAVNGYGLKKTKSMESEKGSAGSSEFACRGGSCIISPTGDVLAGPLWEKENELLVVDVDFDDCLRGRLDLDVAGSYSRSVSCLPR